MVRSPPMDPSVPPHPLSGPWLGGSILGLEHGLTLLGSNSSHFVVTAVNPVSTMQGN